MTLDKIAIQYLADDLGAASAALSESKQASGQTAFEHLQKAHDLVNKVQRKLLLALSNRRKP
jgi:predicted DNA-binding protein YlxM (UPF0122 family)